MDTTFLNLLITELKSQDPTAPMDATQMVGQMISLNQLDQLIGIHQLLQSAAVPTTSANGGH
jgi:flagellar basal-body rod modification protein FlgD